MKRVPISNTTEPYFYYIIFVGSDIVEWVIPSTWARGTGQHKDGDEGSGSYSSFLSTTSLFNIFINVMMSSLSSPISVVQSSLSSASSLSSVLFSHHYCHCHHYHQHYSVIIIVSVIIFISIIQSSVLFSHHYH